MRPHTRRCAAPLAVVVAAVVGCADLGAPGGIGAIDFTGVPFPAVVTGDTMRDTLGVAAPLRATVYDATGDIISDADVQYVSLDTGVMIDANGFLRATRRTGTVRVIASVNGLQSQQRLIAVTRAPDSVRAATTELAFSYRIPDATSNVSPTMSLTVQSNDTTGGVGPNVTGWIVRWRIVYQGDTLTPTDTTTAALWSASGTRHSLRDTTKTDGVASRRLRLYSNFLAPQPDSFLVIADVQHRGRHVAGSPVRYVVRIAPPTL